MPPYLRHTPLSLSHSYMATRTRCCVLRPVIVYRSHAVVVELRLGAALSMTRAVVSFVY